MQYWLFKSEPDSFSWEKLKGKEAIDLSRFPAPVWHKRDGGPFLGSGSLVVMRDPDSGWINVAIYRAQVQGKSRVTIQFDHLGRHGVSVTSPHDIR